MAFVKLTQLRSSPQKDVHAVFSTPNKGTGNLRFTRSGMERLRELEIRLAIDDRVHLFFDKTTGQVALQRAEDGVFKLSRSSMKNDTMRITSKALSRNLGGLKKRFRLEASGKFDAVLLPYSERSS